VTRPPNLAFSLEMEFAGKLDGATGLGVTAGIDRLTNREIVMGAEARARSFVCICLTVREWAGAIFAECLALTHRP
jgi:hypothetical protein